MRDFKPCIFCGGTDVEVAEDISPKEKYFFVQCNHCAAQGSAYGAIAIVDGDFDESDEELIEQAILAWNGAGRPTVWQRYIIRPLNQLRYDVGSRIDYWLTK